MDLETIRLLSVFLLGLSLGVCCIAIIDLLVYRKVEKLKNRRVAKPKSRGPFTSIEDGKK